MAAGRIRICRRSSVAALAVGLLAACPAGRSGPPQHYEDPKHMIGVFEDPERDAWQQPDAVVSALPIPNKNGVIADIGAGSGYFTRRLAMRVPEGRVFAVDVDSEFEDYLLSNREAWGTPNIETHLAHYDDPMLPKASLDLVFTANTYAYIRDRVSYFAKVRNALKPDGRLAVIEFRPESTPPGNMAPATQHRIGVDTAKAELAKAGFEVESEPSFLVHQWFLVLRPRP
jgi:predicted methyltransferase